MATVVSTRGIHLQMRSQCAGQAMRVRGELRRSGAPRDCVAGTARVAAARCAPPSACYLAAVPAQHVVCGTPAEGRQYFGGAEHLFEEARDDIDDAAERATGVLDDARGAMASSRSRRRRWRHRRRRRRRPRICSTRTSAWTAQNLPAGRAWPQPESAASAMARRLQARRRAGGGRAAEAATRPTRRRSCRASVSSAPLPPPSPPSATATRRRRQRRGKPAYKQANCGGEAGDQQRAGAAAAASTTTDYAPFNNIC